MSLGYVEHSRTRYLRNHYEIYDYRRERVAEEESLAAARLQREKALEAKQQERREALDALIEANRVYTPSNRLVQQLEDEARQKREEKERERERKQKAAADKAEAEKFKSRLSSRSTFNSRLLTEREERTARLEKQAQYNKIERERRAKERDAKSDAKLGIKADSSDSDSEETKPKTTRYTSSRRSTANPGASSASNRLINKYKDSTPTSTSRRSREPRASSSTDTE